MKHITLILIFVMMVGCAKKESDTLFKSKYSNKFLDQCATQFSEKNINFPMSEVRNYCDCVLADIFVNNSLDSLRKLENTKKEVTIDNVFNNPRVNMLKKSFIACEKKLHFSEKRREARLKHIKKQNHQLAEEKAKQREWAKNVQEMQQRLSKEALEKQNIYQPNAVIGESE